jgi:hypothetical protein
VLQAVEEALAAPDSGGDAASTGSASDVEGDLAGGVFDVVGIGRRRDVGVSHWRAPTVGRADVTRLKMAEERARDATRDAQRMRDEEESRASGSPSQRRRRTGQVDAAARLGAIGSAGALATGLPWRKPKKPKAKPAAPW